MRTDLQLSPWSVSGTGNGWDDDFFESIFFLGNGRMGIRGYLPMEPECRPIQKGVYLAGIFRGNQAGNHRFCEFADTGV